MLHIALAVFSAVRVCLAWMLLPVSKLLNARSKAGPQRQLLVVSLANIGDHILVFPALTALRAKYPLHRITVIVRERSLGLADLLNGAIDREIAFSFCESRNLFIRLSQPWRAMWFVARHGIGRNVDLALIPRWDWDSSGAYYVAFFSQAKRRVTFSEDVNVQKRAFNWLTNSLCTDIVVAAAEQPEAEKIAELLWRSESLRIGPPAKSVIVRAGRERRLHKNPFLVLGPWAGHPKRNWPLESWAQLIDRINDLFPRAEINILGSAAERDAADKLAARAHSASVLCGLPFSELARGIGDADLFVGADSGMAHLAGAIGLPVIQIFCHPATGARDHLNSPTRFAASSIRTTVLQPKANPGCELFCRGTQACCIGNVTTNEVIDAILEMFNEGSAISMSSSTLSNLPDTPVTELNWTHP